MQKMDNTKYQDSLEEHNKGLDKHSNSDINEWEDNDFLVMHDEHNLVTDDKKDQKR